MSAARPRFWLFATRLLAGIAFTTSLMMSLDERRASPAFCRLNEGCDFVTASPFGRPGGVPLADIGVVAFAALFVLSLFPAWRQGRLLRAACITSGLAGTALLLIQWLALGHFCPFCTAIDGCAVGLMLLHIRSRAPQESASLRERWVWTGLLAAAALSCIGFSSLVASQPAPDYVREKWEPGKINIVSVTDFTCPYCRQVDQVLEAHRDDPDLRNVHRVMIVVPRSSSASKLATLAYYAADEQGRGPEMAQKLFAAERFSLDLCLLMAADIGLDVDQFHATLESKELVDRISQNIRRIVGGGLPGLPVTWVDDQQILGQFNLAGLKSALLRARRARED